MEYIDLWDITALEDSEDEDEQETYNMWKHALQDDCGIDIDDLARNEPTMIPDDDFERYAQELAEDIGLIDRGVRWPYTCINWAEAAQELQEDYTSVEVNGITYWFQNY